MILHPYTLSLLTEEDARAMQRELLLFFENNKAKDYPQMAELLRNLSKILK